jgi:hypothetical protein
VKQGTKKGRCYDSGDRSVSLLCLTKRTCARADVTLDQSSMFVCLFVCLFVCVSHKYNLFLTTGSLLIRLGFEVPAAFGLYPVSSTATHITTHLMLCTDYATSRKVAGSTPDDVIGFFN